MGPSKPSWLSWRSHHHGDKKEGKAEDRTKASSSNVAQSQVPPPVPPETQSTQAGEGQAAKESCLRKESAVQETPSLSTSQRLWNEAYDSLKNDNDTSELVKGYVKTLVKCLRAEKARDTSSGADDVSTELEDPTKRQMYMKKLVEEGRAKVSTASKITKGVGDVSEFVLSAKGMIDSAIQNIPQAALPWAGVCVGLQASTNPYNFPIDVHTISINIYLDTLESWESDKI
jgi:N-terminal domain of NWD NACHT-NTPase